MEDKFQTASIKEKLEKPIASSEEEVVRFLLKRAKEREQGGLKLLKIDYTSEAANGAVLIYFRTRERLKPGTIYNLPHCLIFKAMLLQKTTSVPILLKMAGSG